MNIWLAPVPRVPVQAVLDNLDDGMTPDAVAKAYQIDVRLVMGVKQFEHKSYRVLEKRPEKLVLAVDTATEGSYQFVRYELPPKPKRGARGPSI